MTITLLQVFGMIAIFQAFLMSNIFFLNKKSSRIGNIILALMLLIFSIINSFSLFYAISQFRFSSQQLKIFFFVGHLAFLIGPLLYFYVKSLLKIDFSIRKWDWLHFLPFAIAILCSIPIVHQYGILHICQDPSRAYFNGAILIQNLVYFIASFKILQSYGLTFKSFLSYIEDSKLAWVRYFISGYIILWSIQLQLFMGWDILQQFSWCPYTTNLYFLTAFLFFNGMVYIGLKKPELFHQGKKYQYSVLKESDKEQCQEKLTSLLSQEKLYLNPSISLPEIAQRLDIAPRYVSQIINETFRQNFRDFINKYRIEESIRMLSQENQYLNLMGIALDVGFNSKSAFNNAFKKNTGITPKEFRKRLAQRASS